MMGKTAIDLAEEAGYILVAPMGYNTGGWYGSPEFSRGAGKGKGAPPAGPGAPNAANAAPPAAAAAKGPADAAAKGKAGRRRPLQPAICGLSEKDTMNVIAGPQGIQGG
jgi:hypothetical protein